MARISSIIVSYIALKDVLLWYWCFIDKRSYFITTSCIDLVFNMVAWGLDVTGDIVGITFFRSNFLVLNITAVKSKQNSQPNKSSNGESNM